MVNGCCLWLLLLCIGCFSSASYNKLDLQHSTFVLSQSNVNLRQPQTTTLTFTARNRLGQLISGVEPVVAADGCTIDPLPLVDGIRTQADGVLELDVHCTQLGLRKISGAVKLGSQSLPLTASNWLNSYALDGVADSVEGPLALVGMPLIAQVAVSQSNGPELDWQARGVVAMTSSDPLASLPAPYTLTPADNGLHVFTRDLMLRTSGPQILTSTHDERMVTQHQFYMVSRPAAYLVLTVEQESIVAGDVFALHVTALDTEGQATDYVGPVTLSTTDGNAILPKDLHLTITQYAPHVIEGIRLTSAGQQRIELSSHGASVQMLFGRIDLTILAGAPAMVQLEGSADLLAGEALALQIGVVDAFANVLHTPVGTIDLTTTDSLASATPLAHFGGRQGHFAILRTAGRQTLIARIGGMPGVMPAYLEVDVQPKEAYELRIDAPPTAMSLQPFDVTVSAYDMFGNQVTTLIDLLQLQIFPTVPTTPLNFFLEGHQGGTATLSLTLTQATSHQLLIRTLGSRSITPIAAQVDVVAGVCDHIAFTGLPHDVTWEESVTILVQTFDSVGNRCRLTETVHILSSDANDLMFTNLPIPFDATGNGAISVRFPTTGPRILQAVTAQTILNQTPKEVEVLRVEGFAQSGGSLGHHHCAILSNQQIKCWGRNTNGMLGLGDTKNRGDTPMTMGPYLPAVRLPGAHRVKQAAVGVGNVCVLLDDSRVRCWGSNDISGLDTTELAVGIRPEQMGNDLGIEPLLNNSAIVKVVVGNFQICAITDTGQLTCFGAPQNNTLGIGSPIGGLSYARDNLVADLGPGLTALDVSAGGSVQNVNSHRCVLLNTNQLKCWGRNFEGQLGYGDITARVASASMGSNLPFVDLGTGRSILQVVTSHLGSAALLDNQVVQQWGVWNDGSGYGDTIQRGRVLGTMGNNLPVEGVPLAAPGSSPGIVKLVAGNHSLCVTNDLGQAKCWGSNVEGQLGYGDTTPRSASPATMGANLPALQLGHERWVRDIQFGFLSTCFLLDNYQVKCFGSGFFGSIGQEDVQNRGNSPLTIGDALPAVRLW